ncbi:hypothetical protein CHUAL_002224 [Chamberlinius hualienensis]
MPNSSQKIGILGCGLIGRSWSMLFASVGYKVTLYDLLPSQVQSALKEIKEQLEVLEQTGQLRGELSAAEQNACVSGTSSLEDLIKGAFFVLESVPESLEIKRKALTAADVFLEDGAILASSTSAILPSKLAEGLKHAHSFIVTHPVNPPYYVPLVELVPSPWTRPEVLTRTRALMEEIGQSPVTITKELPGFALNRVQYALQAECFNLVADGVMSAEDVDTGFSEGIGRRYAFIGPLETMHLNANGVGDYLDRYGKMIYEVSKEMGPIRKLEGKGAEEIIEAENNRVPLDKLPEARRIRDLNLIALAKIRKDYPYKA